MTIKIDVSEVLAKLDPEDMERHVRLAVGGAIDAHLRPELRKYPDRATPAMKWKSDKQRRWFFWAMRNDLIDVPYRRGQSAGSQNLGKSWTKKVTHDAQGWRGVTGTNVSYAPYVMDKDNQAYIHRGRWQTVQSVAEEQAENVKQFIVSSLIRWAKK